MKKNRVNIICKICQKEFEVTRSIFKRGSTKYCSVKCYGISRRKILFRGCKICNNIFKIRPSQVKKGFGLYCSSKCAHIALKKGKFKYCEVCNKKFWIRTSKINKRKHCSRECYSLAMSKNTGERNPNWKGGIKSLSLIIRNLDEYAKWRKEVFERDSYTCQDCGKDKSGHLEVHHEKEFVFIFREFLQTYSQFSPIEDKETLVRLAISYEPFWEVKNGKTLCEECHNLTREGRYV